MLVFSRKLNETFTVGENVTIKIVEIRGDKVRIGVDAPRDVHVSRDDCKRGPKTDAKK